MTAIQQTPNDKIYEGVMEILNDSSDYLQKNRNQIITAFKELEKSVVGNNTSETIAMARNALVKRLEHKAELDMSSYAMSKETMGDFQKHAIIVTEALSYTIETLIKIIEKLQNSTVMRDIKIQNVQPGMPVIVERHKPGLIERISEALFRDEAKERQQYRKVVGLFERKLREVQNASERWRTWKMQRIKLVQMALFFSEDGKDFNHMYAFLLTEQMDFYDMQERVLPILSAGLRVHETEMQKIYAQQALEMARKESEAQILRHQIQNGSFQAQGNGAGQ